MGPVWVLAEQIESKIVSVSFQLVGRACKLASALDATLEVILLGNHVEAQAEQLIAAGADRVYLGQAEGLAHYQSEAYTDIIVSLAREKQPEIMLIGSTFMGREIAPLLAARLETGLTAHCMDLVLDPDNNLEQKIPAYGGVISITCPQKRPQMATVATGVFPMSEMDPARSGEIIRLAVPELAAGRIETLEVVRQAPQGVPLETAPIIVAGGAGAGNTDGWCQIADLSKVLNATLGCTRPAVDECWAELDSMIGQSGKIVNPLLYIGVGISGDLQHMVGIANAKVMVAVNNDPKSPVFEQVDYGIVEDCREFLPVLIEKIKVYKEKK